MVDLDTVNVDQPRHRIPHTERRQVWFLVVCDDRPTEKHQTKNYPPNHKVRAGSTLYLSLAAASQRAYTVDPERALPRDSAGSKFVRVTVLQVTLTKTLTLTLTLTLIGGGVMFLTGVGEVTFHNCSERGSYSDGGASLMQVA